MSNARGPQRSEDRSVTDADREALRMNAYYYGFTPTGEYAVDKILSAVAHAGKAFHSTEEWSDTDCYKLPDFGGSGCPQEWIQLAAQECAQAIARARAEEREACAKVCDEITEREEREGDHGAWCGPCECAGAIRARSEGGKA